MRSKRFALFVVLGVLAAACGDDAAGDTTTEPEPTTTEAAAPAPDPQQVQAVESRHGVVLADGEGRMLYLFLDDEQGPSTCNGGCATVWPPLVGDVAAGPGVDPGLFGTVARDDGSSQVTYNGWPLYHYAGDTAPGDTRGQAFGDVWWLVNPDGDAVMNPTGSGNLDY